MDTVELYILSFKTKRTCLNACSEPEDFSEDKVTSEGETCTSHVEIDYGKVTINLQFCKFIPAISKE